MGSELQKRIFLEEGQGQFLLCPDFTKQIHPRQLLYLGQVMHLVQDCASPAHVRNDAHPLRDSFEKWTNYNTEISLIVFPTVNTSVAPYGFDPISQFFDTDQYNGSNPSVYTDQGLGIEKE